MPKIKFSLKNKNLDFYFPKKNWDPIAGKDIKVKKEVFEYFENTFSNLTIDYASPGAEFNFILELYLELKQTKPLKRGFSQQIVFNKKHPSPKVQFVSKREEKDSITKEDFWVYTLQFTWEVEEKYGSASKIKNEFGPTTETAVGIRINFLSNSQHKNYNDTGNIFCVIKNAASEIPFEIQY
jgi:hypothetical protein